MKSPRCFHGNLRETAGLPVEDEYFHGLWVLLVAVGVEIFLGGLAPVL